jgi:DNA repair protein RecO (recombination protein O)
LTEAKLERRFRPHGGTLSNLWAAYYVAELLSELTDDYDPHPELFDAADATLAALATSDAVVPCVLRFELTSLNALGHMPSLDTCVECGKPVEPSTRIPFSAVAGGVLCKSCRVGQKGVVSLSAPVLRALGQLAGADGRQALELDARVQGELRAVLNHYWTHLLGHEPRMHRYLTALVR